jgi:hypothetical protein
MPEDNEKINNQDLLKRVPKDYYDFEELYKPQEPKDTLPNFLDFDIFKKVSKIIDKPAESVIVADPTKKVILAKLSDLIAFFLNYSTQLRAIYQKTKSPHLKALIERIIIKNDSYLNSALALYKSEASIYDIKDHQVAVLPIAPGQIPYPYSNYGPQNQQKQQ